MRPRLDALEGYLVDHGADWASRAGDVVSRPFTRLESYCNRRYWARRRRNAPPPSPPVGPFARAMATEFKLWDEAARRDINRQLYEPRFWVPVDDPSITSTPLDPWPDNPEPDDAETL